MDFLGINIIYPAAAGIVAVVAVFVSILSSVMHTKFGDRKGMDALQERIRKNQAAFLDAQKSGDDKKMKRLEAEQKAIMSEFQSKMMKNMKPTIISMPLFLIIIWFLSSNYDKMGPLVDLPFGIPFLTNPVVEAGVVNGVTWFGIYLLTALSMALFLELVVKKALGVK